MLYRFKSKNAGDVIMLEPNGRQVLEIIGKEAGSRGIVLPEQMPAALQALRTAIEQDEAQERQRLLEQDTQRRAQGDGAVSSHQPPGVTLRHRALPFMQMLESSHRDGDSIVWGVCTPLAGQVSANPQSTFAPDSFTTLAHLVISLAW